eukprot:GHRQ01013956.1.p1 GENE.GHRQ01013956.1~~GHRQ01013956.1.p1  ORF type:complete len:219 (+),score=63.16 GHRQ01013956.1:182-838(+)
MAATQLTRKLPRVVFGSSLLSFQGRRQPLNAIRRAATPQQHDATTAAAAPQPAVSRPATCWPTTQQRELVNDVHHLEQSFLQPPAAHSLEPAAALQATVAQAVAVAATTTAAAAGTAAASAEVSSTGLRVQVHSTCIQALSLRETARTAERKLGAGLSAVGYAILIMAAAVMYDRGWNNLLDSFDESVLGDVCCMVAGLGMVFGVKLMGWQPKDFFNV